MLFRRAAAHRHVRRIRSELGELSVPKFAPLWISALFFLQASLPKAGVRGVVVDGAGEPLAGVRVVSLPWGYATTNSEGGFEIDRPADRVRFSRLGFTPVTKTWDKASGTTVLERTSEKPLSLGYCRGDAEEGSYDVGSMRLGPVTEADVIPNVDDDYVSVFIRYRRALLTVGQGPHWSDGLPTRGELEALRSFVERDVLLPYTDDVAAEYTGVEEVGTGWRFIGFFGWTISYIGADVEATEFFDGLIDSMCWVGR